MKKTVFKFLTIYLTFLLKYTLWHPLESPHCGNCIGMPQCIIKWNGIVGWMVEGHPRTIPMKLFQNLSSHLGGEII